MEAREEESNDCFHRHYFVAHNRYPAMSLPDVTQGLALEASLAATVAQISNACQYARNNERCCGHDTAGRDYYNSFDSLQHDAYVKLSIAQKCGRPRPIYQAHFLLSSAV